MRLPFSAHAAVLLSFFAATDANAWVMKCNDGNNKVVGSLECAENQAGTCGVRGGILVSRCGAPPNTATLSLDRFSEWAKDQNFVEPKALYSAVPVADGTFKLSSGVTLRVPESSPLKRELGALAATNELTKKNYANPP